MPQKLDYESVPAFAWRLTTASPLLPLSRPSPGCRFNEACTPSPTQRRHVRSTVVVLTSNAAAISFLPPQSQ
ncbi:MAG: hypothetical protein LH679_00915 [Cyanobacteria bacterium CAN_BIN43]|nr:hypothetical protein [Cyanobacteria bacterium CAN_BIN43]